MLRDRRDDEHRGSPYDAKFNVVEIGAVNMGEIGAVRKTQPLRGHVNKKKFQKSKKTLEGGGWVKCPIGYKKKLENIFLCIISFGFGEHSNIYNVINALLCLDCLL